MVDEEKVAPKGLSEMLNTEEELADLIKEGCKDRNMAARYKFIELSLQLKGLSIDKANDIEVSFTGENNEQIQ